jgi:hypothetical protein
VKILSVDVESNGLHGQPFAIGAICTDDSQPTAVYRARCPINGPVDPWVEANVLPALAGMPELFAADDHPYASMLADFAAWFDANKDGATVIAHCGVPVEARLFADMVGGLDRDPFSGPFPLHDLATLLYAVGADPLSTDGYRAAHGLTLTPAFEGLSPHNPLYDAAVAETCWRHAAGRLARLRVPPVEIRGPHVVTGRTAGIEADGTAVETTAWAE